MFTVLEKLFIAKKFGTGNENVTEEKRGAYGTLCGILGIILNLILFVFKLLAGILSASIAITADSFNNLSDAGSSLITLIGFKLSSQKPDIEHPFGHGRIEYVSGLIVSFLIVIMGFELGKSSVEKVFNPEMPQYELLIFIILAISVLIKFYMFLYNRKVAKKINSEVIKATSLDSLCDAGSTLAVLICSLICKYTGLNIDAYCGLVVAVMILRTGIMSAIDTINPLLGVAPNPEFVKQIYDIVMSYDEVIGIHDLVVHDYGPGRQMISLHAEVPAVSDILKIHDTIDNIEKHLATTLKCEAVIHMDPVRNDDEFTCELYEKVKDIVRRIDEKLNMHDFRTVNGETHTNLIFDIVVPYDCALGVDEITDNIKEQVKKISPSYFCVINVDRSKVK